MSHMQTWHLPLPVSVANGVCTSSKDASVSPMFLKTVSIADVLAFELLLVNLLSNQGLPMFLNYRHKRPAFHFISGFSHN